MNKHKPPNKMTEQLVETFLFRKEAQTPTGDWLNLLAVAAGAFQASLQLKALPQRREQRAEGWGDMFLWEEKEMNGQGHFQTMG